MLRVNIHKAYGFHSTMAEPLPLIRKDATTVGNKHLLHILRMNEKERSFRYRSSIRPCIIFHTNGHLFHINEENYTYKFKNETFRIRDKEFQLPPCFIMVNAMEKLFLVQLLIFHTPSMKIILNLCSMEFKMYPILSCLKLEMFNITLDPPWL